MSRLTRRPWFLPASGAVLYLTGVNNVVLGLAGSAWLSLSRQVQVVVVLWMLVVAGFYLNKAVRARRSAYQAAVAAATVNHRTGGKG